MTDEELIAKFQARVAAGEIDLRPFGELIFGKFDQDWPARLIALARTAVPALIARLEAAEANLKWEQHRAGRIGTHSEDCHTWGPQHYECLLRKFNEAEARIATAYAEGVEAAAAIHTAEVARLEKQIEENIEYMRRVGRSDHSANNHCHEKLRQHLYYAEAIRSLLKDKPNG